MLRPGVTREWVDEGELPKERTLSEVAEALRCIIGATGELDYFSAHIHLREPGKSEDKAEGRALVVKGAEEVENAKANSKYQDKAEAHRPRNIKRPVSTGFSSR
ncbi:hypothetical protein GW17_00013723 [Ensete ventricosum]|nr:hypothetical protein GW17_00013723 [Ensete ventricosum]